MATNSGADKGTRNLVIVMVLFIVAVGVFLYYFPKGKLSLDR